MFLFVRAKTGEIINATVSKSPIRALTVSPNILKNWNAQVNKDTPLTESLLACKKIANRVTTTVACDGQRQQFVFTKKICDDDQINVEVLRSENKKIDLCIRKLRNNVSRLGRKTICTTNKADRLQNHLDLYIDYSNSNRITL